MNAVKKRPPRRAGDPKDVDPHTDWNMLGTTTDEGRLAGAKKAVAANRRKPDGSWRKAHPLTGDPDYTADDEEFLAAVLAWRNKSGRAFPTNVELLGLARQLGYVKVPHGYRLVSYGELVAVMTTDLALPAEERPKLTIFNGEAPCNTAGS
jgi:hypothetical protein